MQKFPLKQLPLWYTHDLSPTYKVTESKQMARGN